MKIRSVKGIELLDSRGNPTVGAKVTFENGVWGAASVPSGASTGKYEACEKRDGDVSRYGGKGVLCAVKAVSGEIDSLLSGRDISSQRELDRALITLDGTENKSRLGANAILAVSLAFARAAAVFIKRPLYEYIGGIGAKTLPRPMMNILNGGVHAANNVDIQEFMITPVFSAAFSERLRACAEVYHSLGGVLKEKNLLCGVGDEGGYAPFLEDDEEALYLICEAVKRAGYSTEEFKICIDTASSGWYKDGIYKMPKRGKEYTAKTLSAYYGTLCEKYPVISIEDGFAEDDFAGFADFTARFGKRIQIVGDDLFVTNVNRLQKGITEGAANAVLIKPNQTGTLTETLDVIEKAQKNGYAAVVSHRSGETEDTFIADIAVGTNAGQIKTGAPCRTDRTAKYNRLLEIERELTT